MTEARNASDTLAALLEKVRLLGPTLWARAVEAERAGRLSDETIADIDGTGSGPYPVGAQVSIDDQRFLDDWRVAGMCSLDSFAPASLKKGSLWCARPC